jgi:membrane fusion protein, heavy metal efflux system
MSAFLARQFGLSLQIRQQAFQLCVIAVLAATGLWGHKHHWQFPVVQAGVEETHAVAAAGEFKAAPLVAPPTALSAPHLADGDSPALAHVRFPRSTSIDDLGIRIDAARPRALARQVSAPATVIYVPSRHAQLSVRASGTVWRIQKHLGQATHAGEVLAVIDSPALGQAKADFLHSIADVQLSQKVYEPLQKFANGEVSVKQVRAAETELRKAKVDMFNAHQALISLGLPIDLEECQTLSEAELENRVKFLGLPQMLVNELDADATSANLLPIHAPFDGLVIGHDLSIGEVVSPSQTYFEVADVSKMWILLNVRETDSDDLEIGQKVSFSAGSAAVTGAISWMSTAVDPKTRTVEVRCEVDNPEVVKDNGDSTGKRLLRANMFGVAKIELARNPVALSVPTKAVQWDGKEHVIFVKMDAQSFEPRRVRLGIVTDEFSEVLEHLSIDDPVAVEGSHILKAELTRSAMAATP